MGEEEGEGQRKERINPTLSPCSVVSATPTPQLSLKGFAVAWTLKRHNLAFEDKQ